MPPKKLGTKKTNCKEFRYFLGRRSFLTKNDWESKEMIEEW